MKGRRFNGTKTGRRRHHWLIIGWSARKTARWSSVGGTEMGHSPHDTHVGCRLMKPNESGFA
jgi:hypothetical protein